jgi:hypothetical protein
MRLQHRNVFVVAAILGLVCVFLFMGTRTVRAPLVAMPTTSPIQLSSLDVTVGTNHSYYHGASSELLDSLAARLTRSTGNRLRWATSESATVVWMRFQHRDFGVMPLRGQPPHHTRFSAQLIEPSGVVAPLRIISTSAHYVVGTFLIILVLTHIYSPLNHSFM